MADRRGETAALGTSGRFAFHERSDRDDSGALVTSAINRSLLAGAGTGSSRAPALAGILVQESRRGRRRALAIVFRDKHDVISCDGGPDSDDEEDEVADGDDELAEPSEVLSPEDHTFRNLTKRNTDFNSINSNLTGASRTMVDWVDDNDRTTERSALTGRHKKFTPVVSVAPFSTGRGPGPLKINPVAPMQNGEVVSTGRIQEMVEKRGVADRVAKREQQVTRLDKVTRLDDKVTRLDDKNEKITRLDENDTKVTRLDEKVLKSDEKVTQLDGRVTELDDKVIRPNKETKNKKISREASEEGTNENNSNPTSVKTKTISAGKAPDVKSSSNTGSKSITEGTSQPKAGLGSHAAGTGNVESPKPVHRQPTADRSRAAAVESGDVGGEPASPDPPMSNIDMIKARLAEKASQKGPASWRSPGKHPERNRARLNSLDGVPKSPKLKALRSATEGSSGTGGETDASRTKSVPRAGDPASTIPSRTPACDRVTEPAAPEPAGGEGKNEPPAGPGTNRQHLSDRDRSANTDGAGPVAAACDEEKLAAVGVKPAPGDHKPSIVNDKPKLAAKPGKVKALSQPVGRDGAGRRLSREVGAAQPTPSSPKTAEAREKAGLENDPKSYAETYKENATVNLSEQPTEPDKSQSRLSKGLNEEFMSQDLPVEDSQSKSSYSPKSSMHKHSETKASAVETKTQRAMKREKELERQREELEKKNRDEKKTSSPSETARSEHRPSVTSQETEPSTTIASTRRDSPPSVDVPPSVHTSNGSGSGLYAQIQQADQRRMSRDSGPPLRPAPEPSPPSEPRAEPPPPTASQRSSISTEDDDEEEDEPPVPLQRTVSVSPRSRRKRGGVSFAPNTEDPRPSGVKPRSQSMPRPSALDARLGRDEAVRGGRLSGGGGGEERRSRRDEPRSRARFSLKKFLKFGRDEKRKEKDQVYGEFRAKPEIIHPIDRAGVGCVQVIGRPSDQRRREEAEQRHRRERLAQDAAAGQDSSTPTVSYQQTPPRLPERQSHSSHPSHPSHSSHPSHHGHHGHPTHDGHPSHASHRISTGLTPEGRPKPPPPPPPSSCRQSGDPLTPPTRPPPPNPHLLSRSRDGWARPPDTDYANLGVSRAGLTPKKPGRGARSRERAEGCCSSDQRAAAQQESDQDGLRRQHPCRLSLREAPACAPPGSLSDSYDAVTASNRAALSQLWEQMSRSVPAPLLPLQAAPLSLRDFQVSPRSLLAVGRHMFVAALHGGQPVALCLTAGPMGPAPLSVPAVADFTDSVPTRLLAAIDGEDGSQAIGTVHVIPAVRVRPLSAALSAPPPVTSEDMTSHTAWLLLLLQTVQQLQLLSAGGQLTVDEELSQLVVLTAEWLPQPRLAAVLTPPDPPPAGGGLSPCVAALSVLLRLLGVPAATQRARDGRGVSSVPDGPGVTTFELLASLLQRDDAASLRRAAAVLGCLLWAPAGLAPAEAPRWLHRERAALLGAAVRTQPLAGDERLRLGFLAETEPETVADALELIDI